MKKKLFSLLLIAVMVLSSFSAVFAAEHEVTITDTQNGEHTYEVYKIFDGTLEKDVLTNITWANGAGSGLQDALKNDTVFGSKFANCSDAPAFAKAMGGLNADEVKHLADVINANLGTAVGTTTGKKITVPSDGWYFIKDVTTNLAEGDALSDYMLEVIGDTTIAAKSDTVSSDKKVKEKNDTDATETDWQDAADYDIGDAVPFRLHGTVPSDYDKYTKYTYIFHDEQSAGLDYPTDFVVTYVNKDKTTGTIDASKYQVIDKREDTKDSCTFEVVFGTDELGLKAIPEIKAGADIYVEYKSVLNSQAKHGEAGNPNKTCLEYSNNPNPDGEGTNKTPEDKVTVFTFKIVANKVGDDNTTPLKGAAFALYKKVPEGTTGAVQLKAFKNVQEGTFEEDKYIDGWYVTVKENFTAGDATSFEFTGKDAGEYLLRETTIPSGYNGVDDTKFTVTATYDTESADPKLKSLTVDNDKVTLIADTETDKKVGVETKIQNKSGSVLPETGGIGTTIIYILGAALVIGAGVMLVTRKKMND